MVIIKGFLTAEEIQYIFKAFLEYCVADASPCFAESLLGAVYGLGNRASHFFAQSGKETIKHRRNGQFCVLEEKFHHSPEGEFPAVACKSPFSKARPAERIRVRECIADDIRNNFN